MSRYDHLLNESIKIFEEKYANILAYEYLLVSPKDQKLLYISNKIVKLSYSVSTSKFGLGCLNDSFKTPIGLHSIIEKIGYKMPIFTIFKGRKTIDNNITLQDFYKDQKTYDEHFKHQEDIITSRILRLKGLEQDINLGGNVDSFLRYIYIHGTAHEDQIGSRASHGCIRMSNQDIIDLFDKCLVNMLVLILNN